MLGMSAMEIAAKELEWMIGVSNANTKVLPGPIINVLGYGAVGDGITDDTEAIQRAANEVSTYGMLYFPPGKRFKITSTIALPISGVIVIAWGATIILDADTVAFDLNPNFDANNIESSSQSYGYWYGGLLDSTLSNPSNATAFKIYGIRQMVFRDVRIGRFGTVTFKNGFEISCLGGHLIDKARIIHVDRGIYVPDIGLRNASVPVTTSTFQNIETILDSGQSAFFVEGGWNRWRIYGGFTNCPVNSTAMYFCNKFSGSTPNHNLLIQGVGFEQLQANSKFLHFDDISGEKMSSITVQNCSFVGDPSGGGAYGIDFEQSININITGCRFEQQQGSGNASLRFDSNCGEIKIDRSNNFPSTGDGILTETSRAAITMEPEINRFSYLNLPGYNGDSFSSQTITLDMSALMGGNFPIHLPPLGYFIQVQARDSGSSGSTTAGVEIMQRSTTNSVNRMILNLAGIPDNKRISAEGYVPADENGDIAIQIYASGGSSTETLELWIKVVGIHN